MYRYSIALTLLLMLPGLAAAKDAGNLPYVHSDLDGMFYARCVPDGSAGSGGKTEIWKVAKPSDERVDTYDWYTTRGVKLGWSPIAGKVAVMRLFDNAASDAPLEERPEFSFYLGGALLKSYTTRKLIDLGATEAQKFAGRTSQLSYRAAGCEQVPGTNEYNFVVELNSVTRLYFDILTGELRRSSAQSEHPNFKGCMTDEPLPAQLIAAYEAFVKCVKERPADATESALPASVTMTHDPRAAGKEMHGAEMNVPFLKSGFDANVLLARRESEDCFLLRTATSAIWFVNVKSGWKIYRYLDKPIE